MPRASAPSSRRTQARILAPHLAFRDLAPGEVLVGEGTSDNHLYVIVRGSLGVVRNAGNARPGHAC